MLTQIQTRVVRVIAFGSWTLGKSEWNYCVTNAELLAIKYFMEYYKHYLLGQCFRLCSDLKVLKWLFSLKEPKLRVARWIKALSEFYFKVWPNKKHKKQMHCPAWSPNLRNCSCPPMEESRLPCKTWQKCLRWAELMWGEILGVPTISGATHAESSQALRIVSKGADLPEWENPYL